MRFYMNKKSEIALVVEKEWINNMVSDDIHPGETITVSVSYPPKEGMLVLVTKSEENYITYYQEGLEGNIYTVLSIKSSV